MNFLRNKLAERIFLYLLLFSVFTTLILASGHVIYEYRKNMAAISDRLNIIQLSRVGNIENSLWTMNEKGVQGQLQGIVRQSDIVYAAVNDDQSEPVYSVGGHPVGRFVQREYPLVYVYRGQEHQLGSLEVVVDLSGVYQRLLGQAVTIVFVEAVKIFMVSVFLFLVVQLVITRHLTTLSEYTQAFRLGNLPQPVRLKRSKRIFRGADEIDGLVSAINSMRNTLHETYEDLVASTEVLVRAQHVGHIGNWHWDLVTNVTTWSDELCVIVGIAPAEYDGTYEIYLSCIHPEDKQHFQDLTARIMVEKAPYHAEYRIVRKDNDQVRYVQEDGLISVDGEGNVTDILGTIQDITERKVAEIERENAKALLECLIDSIPDLIFYKDRDGVFLGGNRSFCEFIGRREEDIVGNTDFDFFSDEMAEFFRKKDREMLEIGQAKSNEEWVDYPDGRRVLLETLKTPYYGPEGEVLGLIGVSRDQTLRKRMKVRLEKSEEKFRQLAENIQEVFWIYSRESKDLQYVSPAFETIWGRPCESLYEDPKALLETIVPEDLERVSRAVTEKSLKQYLYLPEFRIVRQDGSIRWVSAKIFPVYDARGEVYRYAGIAEDITARKRNEEALRQSQKMEAIGTLAGGIAHDFNNILTAILGYSELALLDLPENSPTKDSIEQVYQAGNRAKELVRQILSFSRQSSTSRSPQKLTVLAKETLRMLYATLPANIIINQEIAPDCGLILADITQIHQVLMNLCTNAAHAMEEHGGTLTIVIQESSFTAEDEQKPNELPPGDYVQLTVRDTGQGIPDGVAEHIFEPYYTTKGQGQGTGLGLSVVHGIVADHDGSIHVSSTVGQGACFDIFFPKIMTGQAGIETVGQKSYPGTESILLVDDEKAIVAVDKKMLEDLGYHVTTAANGEEGLAIFQGQPEKFQVLITDQTMPGMSGSELAQEVLRINPDLPIILCTGFSNTITVDKAKALGIREFAMKPVSGRDLAEIIRSLFDREE